MIGCLIYEYWRLYRLRKIAKELNDIRFRNNLSEIQ
ncbi:MAG: hypothetical protein K0R54_106 [Clostridiaceae bacterium]|jgi:hypothetical protein|nr:hypothetical protein [Clostridiaceae bacterium]